MKETLLFIFFILLFLGGFSQVRSISNYEKKAHITKMNFQASTETENYDIIYHRILWLIDPSVRFISGEVTSYFIANDDNISSIYFDLIDSLSVDSVKQNSTLIQYSHKDNLLKISLSKIINKGEIDSVTVYYGGEPQSLTGFGSFETSTHGDDSIPIMWTLSEPYGAREWWPCKQSLTDKIDSIDIYIETPLENKVGSNGVLISEIIDSNKKVTYWKHRHPIASYLVAIAVTNYESYSHYAMVNEVDSVEILNYVYPESRVDVENDTKYTVDVIELFSNLFIPYPFADEKYGHAQFGWSGGMEHQTMSFMGGFSEHLITHELAHQWFGDYITCGSWQHIWINEGFAVFCEYVAQEYLHPDEYLSWKKDKLTYVLDNTKSGSVFVEDTTDVNRIFNYALTYQKGGFILQMLRKQIGDDAFFEGTKEYLSNDKYTGNFAIAEDYMDCIESAADTNLTTFFSDWYYGQGYPEYKIKWVQDLDDIVSINFSQTTTNSSVLFFAMHIPILLKGANKSELVTFYNTQNNQDFTYTTDFIVDDIIFDPDYDILSNHPAEIIWDIKENEVKDGVYVMPNPVKDIVKIRATKGHNFNLVDIIDVSGKEVYIKNFNEAQRKADVNISILPIGIYYIRVNSNNGVIVTKIIKA